MKIALVLGLISFDLSLPKLNLILNRAEDVPGFVVGKLREHCHLQRKVEQILYQLNSESHIIIKSHLLQYKDVAKVIPLRHFLL